MIYVILLFDFRLKMARTKSVSLAPGYTLILWMTMFTWNHIGLARALRAMLQMLVWQTMIALLAMIMVLINHGVLATFLISVIFLLVSAFSYM
jgi:hypothetical protein